MKNEFVDEWIVEPLQQVTTTFEIGSRPKGGVSHIQEGVPSLSAEHMNNNGSFKLNNLRYIPFDYFENLKTGIIQINDILIVKDGATTGKSVFVDENFPFKNAAINEHVFLLRTNGKVIPKFLFYMIFSPYGQKQVKKSFHGGTIGGINKDFLKEFMVLYPKNLEIQKQIVSKLDRRMAQIEMMKEEAEKQGDALRSLFLSYISEKFDENFPTEKLDYLADEIKNGVYKSPSFRGMGHKLVRMYNIENDSIELNDNSLELIELTNDELENYALQKGDVLISRVNSAELVGKCGVIKDKLVGYAYENMVMRVRVNHLKLIPDYLAYFLISPKGKNEIRSRARHAINQSSINNKDVGNIPVPLPPTLDIQKTIVRDLSSKFEYIEGLENQIKIQLTAIECLKSSILNEVFSKYEIPDEA